ncbi:carboxymuconolactone decarboxylase family protein [Vibrio natriegens]|uniref:4-carboxymuconolactone decarboxylase n=1 Tax=Vibrio natriegens NBRC 15636 = ATCC 14048 = DSM 759 TaxID=1219067 RepID=A0AAN0Y687_VIBNA|nr:4-carboxymuconolactone decarboxylase [Vibrio natriegens NBRC 15636 = ATCC 14048 = DSM 759]ANQ14559.1 4-carboxymuconolactone decarboxylase [Vibrio natriegens NBRC 15636 = ATCC 14048 = DSM 759]EPM39592.1 carboxymuconolactone decarboxylase [Vibrio natriegens NBRC 15636 = ATCC 14048 = DSM 759]
MFHIGRYFSKWSIFVASLLAVLTMNTATAAEGFDTKEKAIIPIAAFAASGEIEKLKVSLNEGLDAGLTINETKEVLGQLYAYAGFPRSLNALAAFMQVLEERKSNGIEDVVGPESSPLPTDKTSLEFGAENQTKLIGVEVKGPLFDFSPQIDEYLKSHLFGDIFARDVLTWKQREVATIATLSNIPGVNSQLAAHYSISMNNDVTVDELKEFITIIEKQVGEDVANNAQQVLDSVLNK